MFVRSKIGVSSKKSASVGYKLDGSLLCVSRLWYLVVGVCAMFLILAVHRVPLDEAARPDLDKDFTSSAHRATANSTTSDIRGRRPLILLSRPQDSDDCNLITHTVVSRLGNQMFAFASTLGISVMYRRRGLRRMLDGRGLDDRTYEDAPENRNVIDVRGAWCVCIRPDSILRKTFEPLSDWPECTRREVLDRNNALQYGNTFFWSRYDRKLMSDLPLTQDVIMSNLLQSWRYFRSVEAELRHLFDFREEVSSVARQALDDAIRQLPVRCRSTECPTKKNFSDFSRVVTVGVHVRIGDFVADENSQVGYVTVDAGYLNRAFNYMETFLLHARRRDFGGNSSSNSSDVQLIFVVVSDDMSWCRRNIPVDRGNRSQVVFVSTGRPECDLAVLARCNHTIMSTGTYSWWAAWLANGKTVYYRNHPRPGSLISIGHNAEDYYPSKWIGLA